MGNNKVLDGLFGVCVGDALGVPIEFVSREKLKHIHITKMVGFGCYN